MKGVLFFIGALIGILIFVYFVENSIQDKIEDQKTNLFEAEKMDLILANNTCYLVVRNLGDEKKIVLKNLPGQETQEYSYSDLGKDFKIFKKPKNHKEYLEILESNIF